MCEDCTSSALIFLLFPDWQAKTVAIYSPTNWMSNQFAGFGLGPLHTLTVHTHTHTHTHTLTHTHTHTIRSHVPGLLISIDQVQPSHFTGWQTSRTKLRKTSVCSQNGHRSALSPIVLLQRTPRCAQLWSCHDWIWGITLQVIWFCYQQFILYCGVQFPFSLKM